jgi:hypothetical protein
VERCGPEQILMYGSFVVRVLSVRVNRNNKALTVEASLPRSPWLFFTVLLSLLHIRSENFLSNVQHYVGIVAFLFMHWWHAGCAQELLEQKKTIHCSAFSCILDELDRELHSIAEGQGAEARLSSDPSRAYNPATNRPFTVEDILELILSRAREVFSRHRAIRPENYIDDAAFKLLVHEMLDTRTMAVSALLLYLEDNSQYIQLATKYSLRDLHRAHIAFRARLMRSLEGSALRDAAEQLCVMQGLIVAHAQEVYADGEGPLERAASDGALDQSRVRLLLIAGSTDGQKAVLGAARSGCAGSVGALIGALGAEACLHYSSQVKLSRLKKRSCFQACSSLHFQPSSV